MDVLSFLAGTRTFSLKKLLIAVGLAALLTSWLGNELWWRREELIARTQISRLGGFTRAAEMGIVFFPVENVSLTEPAVDDEDIIDITRLRSPYIVDLSNTSITDRSLPHLYRFSKLSRLDLRGTQVSDKGIQELKKHLPQCRVEH
ncbi:MAG: hypothetical protein SGJ20_00365 [Planctomycetota bacterium]|nr:hypothetical protein [Planctomycetota bacterium]